MLIQFFIVEQNKKKIPFYQKFDFVTSKRQGEEKRINLKSSFPASAYMTPNLVLSVTRVQLVCE